MFAEEIRRAAEVAPRVKLPEVAALLWRAFGAGQVTEAEAEALSNLIEARKAAPTPLGAPRRAVGSRPRSDASMARRRRWAASGRLPPAIATRFTLAETAVLAVVLCRDRPARRLSDVHRPHCCGCRREPQHREERSATGPHAGFAHYRGAGADGMAQSVERRADRVAGVDRLDAAGPPNLTSRGRGQICDPHEYSRV